MDQKSDLPSYEQPPVQEVVCGLLFAPLSSFYAPHLGLLWSKFKDEYPTCQEVSPLMPTVEAYGDSKSEQSFELRDLPPLPRVWFVHYDNTRVIQIQRDRLLHNWRKVADQDTYPRYEDVVQRFASHLKTFNQFLNESSLGPLEVRQCEMTYVNHIPLGEAWQSLEDLTKLFPDFSWRTNGSRFLPQPEQINWRTSFLFPEKQGRLHVTIRNTKRKHDDTPIILFELTARGKPAGQDQESFWKWFDLAHAWIVRAFADLTGETIQKSVWKRTR